MSAFYSKWVHLHGKKRKSLRKKKSCPLFLIAQSCFGGLWGSQQEQLTLGAAYSLTLEMSPQETCHNVYIWVLH